MTNSSMRIRANRASGELEIEGSPDDVVERWEKVRPPVIETRDRYDSRRRPVGGNTEKPEVVGGSFSDFRSAITDVDKS